MLGTRQRGLQLGNSGFCGFGPGFCGLALSGFPFGPGLGPFLVCFDLGPMADVPVHYLPEASSSPSMRTSRPSTSLRMVRSPSISRDSSG